MYCVFKNKVEVDVNAFRLIGASSKETDSTKIGFWGSGLKYSLAVLLRNNIGIKIYSGEKEIKIGLRKSVMRGETFQVVTINGTPTSITTRMGKDWELWFAIRELYSNGLDEEGFELKVEDTPSAEKGYTKIYVEFTDGIKEVFDNFDSYFSKNRKPIFRLDGCKIYDRMMDDKNIIYRKGIRCHNGQENLLFDYDFKDININESRVITSGFELDFELVTLWKKNASEGMIDRFLSSDCYEKSNLNWSWNGSFCGAWFERLKDILIIPQEFGGYYAEDFSKKHVVLPMIMCKCLNQSFPKLNIRGLTKNGGVGFKKVEKTNEYEDMIKRAGITLKKLIEVEKYPIEVVKMIDEQTLGLADEGVIYLDQSVFDRQGLLESTLLEEFLHLEYGLEDNTRRMQTFLFKTIVELLK